MTFLYLLLVMLAHEAGHACAAQALGHRWQPFFRLNAIGVAVVVPDGGLSRRADVTIAAAGPGVSLALVGLWPLAPALALFSLTLAVLNLLPFLPGSDGHRIQRAVRANPTN